MRTIFVGGSRHVTRLPPEATQRLAEMIVHGDHVIIGDANGADKAVQRYFLNASYENVRIYCAGDRPRNNLRPWDINQVYPDKTLRGFHFYAEKDRAMARIADVGLMIWDGKSPGTALNVLRLIRAGKQALLLNVPNGEIMMFETATDWEGFLARCNDDFRLALRERATNEEWSPTQQRNATESLLAAQPRLFG